MYEFNLYFCLTETWITVFWIVAGIFGYILSGLIGLGIFGRIDSHILTSSDGEEVIRVLSMVLGPLALVVSFVIGIYLIIYKLLGWIPRKIAGIK